MDDCCAAASCQPATPDPVYRRILWTALGLNAAMFLVEVVASIAAHSVSLQADALDFLGDAANYGVSLFVLAKAVQWRARTAFGKGLVMGVFGVWVAANTVWHAISGGLPSSEIMSGVGLLALAVNICVAVLLYRHRSGDSNRLSVWLCTRNDAIANVAVILAGFGVSITETHWPDVLVAAVIAALGLSGAWRVIGRARAELRAHPAAISAAAK
jgi:Co/Zn/Cd efflux system component